MIITIQTPQGEDPTPLASRLWNGKRTYWIKEQDLDEPGVWREELNPDIEMIIVHQVNHYWSTISFFLEDRIRVPGTKGKYVELKTPDVIIIRGPKP